VANTTLIMVPVPEERVLEVYALLAASGDSPPASAVSAAAAPDAIADEELIAKAYRQSPEAMTLFLDYLADHPGQVIKSSEIAEAIGRTGPQQAGVLGAFGRRMKNRYGQEKWFFSAYWDHDVGSMVYSMSPEAADVIKRTRKGK